MNVLRMALFDYAVDSTPYDGGISPDEMRTFLHAARNVNTIVESGRGYHAYSTRVLGSWQHQRPLFRQVISVDWEQRLWNSIVSRWRCRGANVLLERADATVRLPELCQKFTVPFAVLVDGPKALTGVRLLKGLWDSNPNLQVVALHGFDQHVQHAFEEAFPHSFYCDRLLVGIR